MLKYPTSFAQTEKNLIKAIKDLQKNYKIIKKNGLSPFADPNSELLSTQQKQLILAYQNSNSQYAKKISDYSNFVEYIPNRYAPLSVRNGIYTPPTDANIFLYTFIVSAIVFIIGIIGMNFSNNTDVSNFYTSLMASSFLPLVGSLAIYGLRKI